MNPDTPDIPPSPIKEASAAAVGGVAPVVAPSVVHARHPVSWMSVLALVVAALSLVLAGLIWQKLGFTQQELARRSQDSTEQAVEVRTVAKQAEALTQELQARLAVAEIKLSEVTLQRSQLEELMLALSRSRDDNLVQDIESALRLGFQQTQLTGSVQPLVSALLAADQRIARAAQPRLNPVQRAIQRDIERIRGAALTDVPTLVLRVDELARQVDDWPVQNDVGVKTASNKARPAPIAAPGKAAVRPPAAKAEAPDPAEPSQPVQDSGWSRATEVWSSFWQRVWTDVTRSGRELVRVSRIDRPEAALLAPEQAFFLRENIKLRLLNARLGLLSRQLNAVEADLKSTEAALGRYFDTTAPQVMAAQKTLGQLRTELSTVELPRPDESLAALAAAAGGR
ncbi:uroporphyrinogen-III C-methyltransferase [Hydrogenophaga taeniospiralis]|uniref:uroporphyrinogen-III C-methyltransferase n=1 Tax=Hydrogenophaga taeniospiralis TaxID=65656 RepID=UPI001CFB8618|nr:uroporphyrinogen-III C-methyltransferase [Hydrogenophaga taeniospiralis]UCU93089.1 uroporphyrinogen-III C-methyltransferase [Hydrogenophaga taeniospiralis]